MSDLLEDVVVEVRQVMIGPGQVEELRELDESLHILAAPCLDEDEPPPDGEGPCAKCAAYLPLRRAIRAIISGYERAA